jgi:uncharacterized protein (TIGR01244 family)
MFRPLDDGFSVSPQITAEDVEAARSLGYMTVVCNRPDGEEPGQPSAAQIEAAAKAAGLSFIHIPMGQAPVTDHDVDAMAAAAAAPGKTLAYCRSGTRSSILWAMAEAKAGRPVDGILEKAAAAGYDLEGQRPVLERLAG